MPPQKELLMFNLKPLISSPTYFQSTNPTCIDLILTNQEDFLIILICVKQGYLIIIIQLKKISKGSTKTVFYRDHKKFQENKFAKDLTHELQNIKNSSCSQLEKAFVTVLEKHVPLKKKQLRLNHSRFMTKALQKAIMTRSSLKNIYKKKSIL